MKLIFHEYADLFPMMDKAAFKGLVLDIKKNGLLEPIVIYDNKVLDGRNRYEACIETGIEPRYENPSIKDPLEYVLSKNLNRRHLNESQRAMIAARLANMSEGRSSTGSIELVSQKDAASLLKISVSTLKRAKSVIEKSPELTEKLDAGKIKVSKAYNQVRREEMRAASIEAGRKIPDKPLPTQVSVESYETVYPRIPPSGYKKFGSVTWEMFSEQEWLANQIIYEVSVSIAGHFNGLNTKHFKGLTQEQALEALDTARAVIAKGLQAQNTHQRYYDIKAWEKRQEK